MKRIALPALLILSACATPQERCINSATRDMRVVDQLISESQATLARGYGLQEKTIYRTEFEDCTPAPTTKYPDPKPRMCPVQVPQTVTEPVSVDLRAESAKLASLQSKRASQAKLAQSAVAQCRAEFPE